MKRFSKLFCTLFLGLVSISCMSCNKTQSEPVYIDYSKLNFEEITKEECAKAFNLLYKNMQDCNPYYEILKTHFHGQSTYSSMLLVDLKSGYYLCTDLDKKSVEMNSVELNNNITIEQNSNGWKVDFFKEFRSRIKEYFGIFSNNITFEDFNSWIGGIDDQKFYKSEDGFYKVTCPSIIGSHVDEETNDWICVWETTIYYFDSNLIHQIDCSRGYDNTCGYGNYENDRYISLKIKRSSSHIVYSKNNDVNNLLTSKKNVKPPKFLSVDNLFNDYKALKYEEYNELSAYEALMNAYNNYKKSKGTFASKYSLQNIDLYTTVEDKNKQTSLTYSINCESPSDFSYYYVDYKNDINKHAYRNSNNICAYTENLTYSGNHPYELAFDKAFTFIKEYEPKLYKNNENGIYKIIYKGGSIHTSLVSIDLEFFFNDKNEFYFNDKFSFSLNIVPVDRSIVYKDIIIFQNFHNFFSKIILP